MNIYHPTDCLGYVYLWRDRRRSMYYVGSHYYGRRYYICSSRWLKNAIRKRPQDFSRRIIFKLTDGTKEDLHKVEQLYLNMIKPEELGIRYYNLKRQATGGNGGARKNQTNTPESNLARSLTQKGKKKPPSHSEKLRAIAKTRYKIKKDDGTWTWGYKA